jgi:hypothetical protein
MYTVSEIRKAFKLIGYTKYEINHIINLLKEIKNDRKRNKPNLSRD